VRVTAASVFEADAFGVAEFRKRVLMETAPGLATRITVTLESPSTVHDVPMRKLQPWLEGGAKSLAEQAGKVAGRSR
jgi:hypothetical protein